jgi:hypothetical protein
LGIGQCHARSIAAKGPASIWISEIHLDSTRFKRGDHHKTV